MKTVDVMNGLGLVAALVLATLATLIGPGDREGRVRPPSFATPVEIIELDDGTRALVDSSGTAVPLRRYERIASASTIADHLLLELAEPERLIAITTFTAENEQYAFRFGDRPAINGITDTERMLSLAPDLLLVNNVFHDAGPLARLREAGITVFDLGEMRGMQTFLPNIDAVAVLVEAESRGAALKRRFLRRMDSVAEWLPEDERREGIYLSTYGDQLYGGTLGTSFNDVLEYAGITDLAADRYTGWPRFRTEEILELNPPLIVTREGGEQSVCRHPGFELVRACQVPGGVVSVTANTFESPGLQMLDAVEELHRKVYGDRPGTRVEDSG